MRDLSGWNWALIVLGASVQGVVATIVEAMLTNGPTWWVFVLGLSIGGIIVLLLVLLTKRRKPSVLPEPRRILVSELGSALDVSSGGGSPVISEVYRPLEGRAFSRRNPGELVSQIVGMTEVAAEVAAKRHIGLWLRVEGEVENVSRTIGLENGLTIHLSPLIPKTNNTSVFLKFDDTQLGLLIKSLEVGDRISAIGKISSISRQGFVSLENCQLIDDETSDSVEGM